MSLSLLRKFRRLAADAAPVIAEHDRRKREWAKERVILAKDHLLRVIAVFRYGDPKIDEPLALAYTRALSKLGGNEEMSLKNLAATLEREQPGCDSKSRFSALIQDMPYWLYYFCFVTHSAWLLGIELPPRPNTAFELRPARSDRDVWPFLPQGVLEPQEPRTDIDDFLDKMSADEQQAYCTLCLKPENELTRREHKFIRDMHRRKWADNQNHGAGSKSGGPSPKRGRARKAG